MASAVIIIISSSVSKAVQKWKNRFFLFPFIFVQPYLNADDGSWTHVVETLSFEFCCGIIFPPTLFSFHIFYLINHFISPYRSIFPTQLYCIACLFLLALLGPAIQWDKLSEKCREHQRKAGEDWCHELEHRHLSSCILDKSFKRL